MKRHRASLAHSAQPAEPSPTVLGVVLLVALLVGCSGNRLKSPKPGIKQQGLASWYGGKFHGRTTANGEKYDQHGISAAHRELPFDTWVEVTNRDNGRKLLVRINDRGPFVSGRIIDLSLGAARKLDMVEAGIARVQIRVVPSPEGSLARAPSGNPAKSQFRVQVGAFRSERMALALQKSLRREVATESGIETTADGWHRVRIRADSEKKARRLVERLRGAGYDPILLRGSDGS